VCERVSRCERKLSLSRIKKSCSSTSQSKDEDERGVSRRVKDRKTTLHEGRSEALRVFSQIASTVEERGRVRGEERDTLTKERERER